MNRRTWLGAAAAALLLSACGFHLRGVGGEVRPLPFSSVWLATGATQLHPHLERQLRFRPDVQMVSQPQAAEAILTVTDERTAKDILTINRGGKVNEYLLVYRVDATVQRRQDDAPQPLSVVVRRELSYSDANVLGKEREEAVLWADMRRDAAEQLIRRLSYLPKPGTDGHAKPASQP